ncbi:hypothetical protein BCV71DRAFT_233058 [Rhizopus microsporus]|uniref:Uncharacterized protein n=1 Tax=Rhizopus microsporus TaxID=58291 RepID=A0A1X0S8N8_RHIZD|nr:hypothetical protein BCV71DRAFT_233058 [Rhizopus microsporus]
MAYKNIIIDRCHILPIVMLVIIVDPVSKVLVLVVVVVIIQLTKGCKVYTLQNYALIEESNDTFITFTTCPLHQLTINSIQHEVRYSFILLKLFLILVAVVFRSSVVSVSLTADSHFNISRHVDGY